jgi:hypothetical protein
LGTLLKLTLLLRRRRAGRTHIIIYYYFFPFVLYSQKMKDKRTKCNNEGCSGRGVNNNNNNNNNNNRDNSTVGDIERMSFREYVGIGRRKARDRP